MMTPEGFSQLYLKLPPLAYRVLDNKAQVEGNATIRKEFNLPPTQWKKFMLLLGSVVIQEFEPGELLANVKKELKLDDKTAQAITLEALGTTILPFEWHVGPVQPIIRELGGDADHYLAVAKKNYPEVYSSLPEKVEAPASDVVVHDPQKSSHSAILDNFDDRLTSFKGRAEILLRLTGLSSQLEEGMKNKTIPETDGQQLMQQLDAISYAVNTQDLNLFEVQSIKRRLTKVLDRISQLGA